MEWKKYPPSDLHHGSECFYQKRIKEIGDYDVYANIVEFKHQDFGNTYELHIQIPEEYSTTGKTINAISFTYKKLDFKKIEKDARKIIDSLTK